VRDIDLEQVIEEWVSSGLMEKRRRPDLAEDDYYTDEDEDSSPRKLDS